MPSLVYRSKTLFEIKIAFDKLPIQATKRYYKYVLPLAYVILMFAQGISFMFFILALKKL